MAHADTNQTQSLSHHDLVEAMYAVFLWVQEENVTLDSVLGLLPLGTKAGVALVPRLGTPGTSGHPSRFMGELRQLWADVFKTVCNFISSPDILI